MTISKLPFAALMLASASCAADLGKVTESPDPCPAGPPGAACRQLVVSCPSLKDIRVQIRITQPTAKPIRGTVVLGSGGNGAGFYAAAPAIYGLVRDLSAIGFLVVDRAWDGGWVTQEGGLKPEA